MIETWDDLDFWKSDDWYWLDDWLKQWASDKKKVNPDRELLFASLDEVPLQDVKVMIVGQDPYPDSELATGVAFSIPKEVKKFPPTLDMVFKEYQNDLHLPRPTSGDLSNWCAEGVLLWNAYPSCFEGKSLSHNFPQWASLSREIVRVLSERRAVLCFCGAIAREFITPEAREQTRVLETAHPSPRGKFGKQPFLGSRIFSRINAELVSLKKEPINWRLP